MSNLYEQDTDSEIALALCRHLSSRTFIDVGAEKGSFSKLLISLNFVGTLFEPFPEHFRALQELVRGTESQAFSFAIDDADRTANLHIAVGDDGAPLDYYHSLTRLESHAVVRHDRSLSVECRSLASLSSDGTIPSEIGFLKIDTEGHDMKVIRGMGDFRAEVLMCEFFTPSLYKGWEFSDPELLIQEAGKKGYEICVAVKRMGAHEIVTSGPTGFVDGQWGNLFFTSRRIFDACAPDIKRAALRCENQLFSTLARNQKDLEEKEAVIQELLRNRQ